MTYLTPMVVVAVLHSIICAYGLIAYLHFHYPDFAGSAQKRFWRIRSTTQEGSELAGTNIESVERSPSSIGEPGSPTMKSSRIAASDDDKPSTAGGESVDKQASDTGAKSSKSGSSRRQQTGTVARPKGLFHYMRIVIAIFCMWYPTSLLVSYFAVFPAASAESICNVLPRLDNFYKVTLRTAILVFYILRLKIVMVTNTLLDKVLIGILGLAVALAYCFGMLLSFYMQPFYYDLSPPEGCGILDMGEWGTIGYSTFVGMSFGIDVILFFRFIFALNIERAAMAKMKASGERGSQFESLIRKTKISYYVVTFFSLAADLVYILINNTFQEEVIYGPNAVQLQEILFPLANILLFMEFTAAAIGILATHSRFKEMLFFGYKRVDASVPKKAVST